MIAPDDVTFQYLAGRPRAPQGAAWEQAGARWRTLPGDPGATFDREEKFDAATLEPMITYGTNPGMVMPISGNIPTRPNDPVFDKALAYMGLLRGHATVLDANTGGGRSSGTARVSSPASGDHDAT